MRGIIHNTYKSRWPSDTPQSDIYFTVGQLIANVISVHLVKCMCDAFWCDVDVCICVCFEAYSICTVPGVPHTLELCQLLSSGRRLILFEVRMYVCVKFFVLLMLFFSQSPSKPSLDVHYLNPTLAVTLLLLHRSWKTHTHVKFFENLANNTVLMITWLTILFEKYVM